MMNKLPLLLLLSVMLVFTSCKKSSKKENDENQQEVAQNKSDNQEITISPVEDSPKYLDAILQMNTPQENDQLSEGVAHFSFNTVNYQLGTQTEDAAIKSCANSAQGQHIHLILNNEPYTAHYEAEFDKKLAAGHYVSLAFLSRSYHESLKLPEAYVLRQFTVGDVDPQEVDLSAPHMFYSRPKGTYTGADTKKILLDFYLVNTTLSADGNKVRATINGKEFMLDRWVPYFIEGLPLGEVTVKLELLDKNGALVPSPYNPVERTIVLEKGEMPS